MERAHAGAVPEKLQPVRRTQVEKFVKELLEQEEEGAAETTCDDAGSEAEPRKK